MFRWRKNFTDLSNMSVEMKIYDAINAICFIGMLFACVLVKIYFNSLTELYVTFGIAIMFLATLLEANRTGKSTSCAVIMSITFNVFYMPLTFLLYGKFICVIPVYFLFGLIYTALTLERRPAIILGTLEAIFYEVFMIWYRTRNPFDYDSIPIGETRLIYGSTIAGVLLVSLCAGAAVRFRYIMFKNEQTRARQLNEKALDAYVAKDMFLINMSHEIRTPMNAIIGNVNLMLDEDVENHTRDNVYNILNSCDALLSTVNELMDLSKTESRQMEVFAVRFDLYELIMEIINMISVRLMESNIDFVVDINKTLPRFVEGDSSKIRQIFINVLNNAIKFTGEGYIKMTIDLEKESAETLILKVSVADTGCGIREDELIKLRKGLMQGISGDMIDSGNMGLGLRITSELLKNMGGHIEVFSDYNVGSDFEFAIPVEIDKNSEGIEDTWLSDFSVLFYEKDEEHGIRLKSIFEDLGVSSHCASGSKDFEQALRTSHFTHVFVAAERYSECLNCIKENIKNEKIIVISDVGGNIDASYVFATIMRPLHSINIYGVLAQENVYSVHRAINRGDFALVGVHILVVDDNYTNLNVASALLKKYGAEVYTASSGLDALRILGEQNFDICFLDYMMPELNGIDTLERIRSLNDSDNRNIPAIALTANVVSGAYEMFMQAGFDGFIPKPIEVGRLEKCLKELLPDEKVIYKNNF